MLLIMLLADITPPKHIAHIMSHIVSIMPRIPLVATRASISAWPVESDVLPKTDIIIALNPAARPARHRAIQKCRIFQRFRLPTK